MQLSDDDSLSTLSEEELHDPYLYLVSNILYEINDILDSVDKIYTFRTFLEREMLKYCNTNKLLRKPEILIRLARLKCTKDKIQGTIDVSIPLIDDDLRNDAKEDPQLLHILHAKSHSVSIGISQILLEGIDLVLFENYIWNQPIINIEKTDNISWEEIQRQKQTYIIDNNLKIIGIPEKDESRTTPECLNIQNSIDQIYQDLYNEKINKIDELLASKENKNTNQFCSKITTATLGLNPALFKEGSQYYNMLGYNPNDNNVSRDNPNPTSNSFAYAGRINNPNSVFGKFGKLSMNNIKNINTGMPINSNCFNKLRYYGIDFPLSKKINNNGKYIPQKNLDMKGGNSILLEFYSRYKKN
jgi:hypothetical protein